MKTFDFLVIGGGVAGMTFALEVAEHGRVAILTKKSVSESSTAWAQGGIAAVSEPEDSIESHIQDTLRAGAGLCKEDVVRFIVSEGPERINELIGRGAHFDKNGDGYHLHREGGHSHRRIYHAADATGWEIQRALLEAARAKPNIEIFEGCNAIDLITTHKLGREALADRRNIALGAYVLMADGSIEPFLARKIMMATGGAGKVYLYTSNPDVATGDGIAMCFRAGSRVANMEFFQFHPTCLYHPRAKSFLITEAMRGEGAILTRICGERFMPDYHPLAELAPRDIVARTIDGVMKQYGEDFVFLDISHRDPGFVKDHFPTIYETCLSFGFDITKGPIPVVPAAHYCCGGIVTDEHGRTDIKNLYAAGECAWTGLHGANRLASNSLLEGLVLASRSARHAITYASDEIKQIEVPEWDIGGAVESDEEVVIAHTWDELRRCMWNYVGIVRTDKRLERALRRCLMIKEEVNDYYWRFMVTGDLLELRNLCLVAELVVRCAMKRKQSVGLHFSLDYPDSGDSKPKDTFLLPGEVYLLPHRTL